MPDLSQLQIALAVPAAFVLVGILGKALAHGWRWSDTYLGMNMALTAMAGAFAYAFDLNNHYKNPDDHSLPREELPNIMQGNMLFLLLAFVVYLVIILMHRGIEDDRKQPIVETIFLTGIANALGASLMFYFIIQVKHH